MQPLRVQCETCHAALQVRDARAIGQVRACPKCGAMVLIGAPGADPTEPQPEESPTLDAAASVGVSPVESTGQRIALAVAGGGMLCVVAAVGVALALRGGAPPEVAAAPLPKEVDPAPPPTNLAPTLEAGPIRDDRSDEPTPPEPASPPPPKQPDLPPREANVDSAPAPSDAAVVESPVSAGVANAPRVDDPIDVAPEKSPPTAKVDPLDFDPASLDLILKRGPQPSPAGDEPAPAAVEAPKVHRGGADRRVAALDQGLAQRAADQRVWSRLGPSAPPDPNRPPPSEALAETLPAIDLEDHPLIDVIEVVGQLAGTPIAIDPQALAYSGVEPRAPIDLRGADQPLGDVLAAALQPLRLACVERAGSLLVTLTDLDRPKTKNYSVDDLVVADRQALLSLLRESLATGNELSFDGARLALAGPQRGHYELLLLCERLRRARGLATRSDYPADRLRIEPALQGLQAILGQRATFSFVGDATLGQALAYWRRQLGVAVLVDWAALAELGLEPATPFTCAARDLPWSEALDGVLGGVGLAWRAVAADALQITTQDAANGRATIEFYYVASPADADELTRRVPGAEATQHDPPSRSLIVRGNAATHRAAWEWVREREAAR